MSSHQAEYFPYLTYFEYLFQLKSLFPISNTPYLNHSLFWMCHYFTDTALFFIIDAAVIPPSIFPAEHSNTSHRFYSSAETEFTPANIRLWRSDVNVFVYTANSSEGWIIKWARHVANVSDVRVWYSVANSDSQDHLLFVYQPHKESRIKEESSSTK